MKKIEAGVCPYCGKTNVEYGVLNVDDNGVSYEVYCNDCKRWFNECYDLDFVGHSLDDDTFEGV